MTAPKDTFWTDDRVAYLREMVASPAKYSAGDMAWRLGCPRNAVIGRVRRMGLELPGHMAGRPMRAPKPKAARVAPFKKPAIRVHQKRIFGSDQVEAVELVELPPPSIDDAARDRASLKTLMELKAGECKWPIGDGPYLFCSSPVASAGAAYCGQGHHNHYKRAYQHRPHSLRVSIPPRTAR